MAQAKNKKDERDAIAKLADRGEQTLAKLADLPGGTKALKGINELRLRYDELAKKARGVDELERRVAKLEHELAAIKRARKARVPRARSSPKPKAPSSPEPMAPSSAEPKAPSSPE